MSTDNRTNGQIVAKALVAHCEDHKMPFPRGSIKKIVEALRVAGRLAGEPTEAQAEAAAKAHEFTNAFGPERETRMRAALAAADARLPSAARIAETLDTHTLGKPNGGSASVAWCDCSCGHREEMWGGTRDVVEARVKLHQAEAVRALFGEVTGDE